MPFAGADGYHSKTLAYSIWHIFRIEDIVAHEMIAGDSQVLFEQNFLDRVGSPIITTGNELQGDENAYWLIDYWCGKDVKGLIQMPFSRHWIMHIEAMRRIKNKLCKIARKGVDPGKDLTDGGHYDTERI